MKERRDEGEEREGGREMRHITLHFLHVGYSPNILTLLILVQLLLSEGLMKLLATNNTL